MLPPDIFTDELLMDLDIELKWTAIGLRMNADDHGRESANPRLVAAAVWPLDSSKTSAVIEDHLLALDYAGYIGLYNVDGRTYYALADWPAVSHAARSRLPAPPPGTFRKSSGGSPEFLSAGERGREREREWVSEGAEGDEERPAGIPPSAFCKMHQPAGTKDNCRHCGTARLAQKQWEDEQRAAAHDD